MRKPPLSTHAVREQQRKVILELLAEGQSLEYAGKAVGLHPTAVLGWTKSNPAFAQDYAQARETGYKLLAEELIEIADTPLPGLIRTIKPNGDVEEKHADMIEHRRLQVDTRKWVLSKMLPKIYGDKIDVDHKHALSDELIKRLSAG